MKKIILSAFALSVVLFSCKKDVKNIDVVNSDKFNTTELSISDFEKSVAILNDGTIEYSEDGNGNIEIALLARVISFDNSYSVLPIYKLNGIEYSDNGQFNDLIADDGIYTSAAKFTITTQYADEINSLLYVNKSSSFLYNTELSMITNDIISARSGVEITLGCDVRLGDCPNTSWYNTSWFGEPCVFFENCKAEVKITL